MTASPQFAAVVPHPSGRLTKFLALDKCLPRRQFLQVVTVGEAVTEPVLRYCPAWLAVLRSTAHLLSVERKPRYTPGPGTTERWDFSPSQEELTSVRERFSQDLEIPYNFEQTALAYRETGAKLNMRQVPKPQANVNSQTTSFCSRLGILDPMALLLRLNGPAVNVNERPNNCSSSVSYADKYSFQRSCDLLKETKPEETKEPETELKKGKLEEKTVADIKPLAMPAPTASADNEGEQFLSIIESIGVGLDENETVNETSVDSLFVIDKAGESLKTIEEIPVVSTDVPKVKKLKRRNAALYADNE